MLSKSLLNPNAQIFFVAGISLFLIGKTVLIVMIPILIYKDVLEPSYKILKFRVQNCCYSSTNLVTRRSRENCPDLEYITTPGVWSTAKD